MLSTNIVVYLIVAQDRKHGHPVRIELTIVYQSSILTITPLQAP